MVPRVVCYVFELMYLGDDCYVVKTFDLSGIIGLRVVNGLDWNLKLVMMLLLC